MATSSSSKKRTTKNAKTAKTAKQAKKASKKRATKKKATRAPGTSIVDELPPPPEEDKESSETLEFLKAIDAWKRRTGKNFPSWTEVLEILHSLGYQKS